MIGMLMDFVATWPLGGAAAIADAAAKTTCETVRTCCPGVVGE